VEVAIERTAVSTGRDRADNSHEWGESDVMGSMACCHEPLRRLVSWTLDRAHP
jgi:hypothetical protein